MGQKYTEAKKTCNKRWDAANLDRMSLAMPKGRKDAIKAHAASMGESLNGFINRAIMQAMDRDDIETPPVCKKDESETVSPKEVIKEFLPKGPVDQLKEVREATQEHVKKREGVCARIMDVLNDKAKEQESGKEKKDSHTLQLRLCRVSGRDGYFHTWETYARPIGDKPFKEGDPVGMFSRIYGIVEFHDGVRRVDPEEIRFCDEVHETLRKMEELDERKDGE